MSASLVERIVERLFAVADGELHVGGVPISQIAERHGTPLYVYDRSVLDRSWERLRRALPDRVEIYYSVKANPNPEIVKVFLSHGSGLEIASAGELFQAITAGGAAERIVFAGPGKRDDELRQFLEAGGGEIHVESLSEARRLRSLAEELGRDVKAAVRVNPGGEVQGGAMRMGGKPAPFGVDEEEMDAVATALDASPRIHVTGVHIFAGTQILDAEILAGQYAKCLELARRLSHRLGRPLETVDFGGGLGIPYFERDEELDMDAYGRAVGALLSGLEGDDDAFGKARFLVEPGRYLVGEAGIYVARVVDVKTSRGKRYVVLDGGMNHHLAASGNLGQVIKRNFPVAVLNRVDTSARVTAEVVGPLCTPLDTIARNADLASPEPGDLVGVFQSGAYARTSSPLGFLSHPSPPEILVTYGEITQIRRRGTLADLVRDCLSEA